MTIRELAEADLAFAVHAWVNGFADSDSALLCCPRDGQHAEQCSACGQWHVKLDEFTRRPNPAQAYWSGHRRLVVQLLARCLTLVDQNEDGLLDGFVCRSRADTPRVAHYVYVRAIARGQGVAKRLLDAAGLAPDADVLYTHRSRKLRDVRLPPKWRYDPYELYWEMMR